jgi:hypothetical protein
VGQYWIGADSDCSYHEAQLLCCFNDFGTGSLANQQTRKNNDRGSDSDDPKHSFPRALDRCALRPKTPNDRIPKLQSASDGLVFQVGRELGTPVVSDGLFHCLQLFKNQRLTNLHFDGLYFCDHFCD